MFYIAHTNVYVFHKAYLRDEERKCERKLTPLNVTCISLSALHVDKEIFVAKV